MKHLMNPDLPSGALTVVRVALSVLVVSFVIIMLAVYFKSFLLVLMGGLLMFSSMVSFLSLAQAPTIKKRLK